jgi:hypothetical protein
MHKPEKASKGSAGIESFQGRLRLRLPRQLYEGSQKYLTLGLADTPENHHIAEQTAHQIELDILSGEFDKTLTKYESRTLSHLFGNTVGKSSTRLSDAFRMVAIMFRVNPKLLFEIQLLKSWIRMSKKLFLMSIRRTLSKWYQRINTLRIRS